MKNSTTIKYVLSTILFFALIFSTSAQLQNANWYFGNNIGLNFNDGTTAPTILTGATLSPALTNVGTITNRPINTDGGVATASDASGNLLFYTDGITVWNKNHAIMNNGTGLFGSKTVSQSVVILPIPNQSDSSQDPLEYYIFTNQGAETGSHGLSYTKVDMNFNAGLGQVKTNIKNIQLLPVASEKMTVAFNPTNNSYWLVSFAPSSDPAVSDTFYSYLVTGTHVNLMSQSTFTFPFMPNNAYTGGQMKISPDGSSLAMAHNTIDRHERYGIRNYTSLFTFEFDMFTGDVYLFTSEYLPNDVTFYGIEFSPDSNLLYVTGTHIMSDQNIYPVHEIETSKLYQLPYRNLTQESCMKVLYEGHDPIYGLQSGIDGKIYTVNSSGNLGVINNPNVEGEWAIYEHERIDLNGKATRELPQGIPIGTLDIIFEQKVYSILSNPFQDELKIKFHATDVFKLKLYHANGRKIKEGEFDITVEDQIIKCDTENLQSGIYYIIIKDQTKNKFYFETVIKTGNNGNDNGNGNGNGKW